MRKLPVPQDKVFQTSQYHSKTLEVHLALLHHEQGKAVFVGSR
jgi:hypothetical protein